MAFDQEADGLDAVLHQIRACNVCAASLPLGPRPIVQAGVGAGLMIIGQAPGARVHESGVPWADQSGDRLRDWTGLGSEVFYDPERVALVPMGFCYPGAEPGGGDRPPRPECAPLWHDKLRRRLPSIRLTLLVGLYAQRAYLKGSARASLTDTVRSFGECPPGLFPLPHPSWRSTGWIRRNPWFETETVPALRARVREALEP